MTKSIAFQGEAGAYSHLACRDYHPDHTPLPCASFQAAFKAVQKGKAQLAMIPVENTLAGRVSDIYHLLPEGGLHIIAEDYLPIRHQLMAVKGAKLDDIKVARSHGDKSIAAVASVLAAELYDLEIIAENIEDADHNTTRFLTLSPEPLVTDKDDGPWVTSFIFKVRNVPSALYKALGGFASNGLNMTKLESYMVGGSFTATQFYADVEGHPDDASMRHALEELDFFTTSVQRLGTYRAHASRSPK